MKGFLSALGFLGCLSVFFLWGNVAQSSGQEKKMCVKKCYKSMYQCLVKGSDLAEGTCFSDNVGQMLMCIDSKGMGSLKRKRLCFGLQKSCKMTCK